MEEKNVIKALAALAQPTRLRVFRWLVVAGRDGATPGAIAAALELPAATLSFHLKELRTAGLIEQERRGRHLVYRTDYARMNDLLSYLTDNCCQGQPCLQATAHPIRPTPTLTDKNNPDDT
ncbi:metalloregulator ArsR/SmtB family transcription factor [Immundisolibacter sp.]|uniref:ArsR/SmtB family transcription factor n=1 Tax=Immundisolibacter sp. TaxID=1934948 RepID=UPI00262E8497|nr:metalloregulator ArsR/SmtB family transcription factor [Immundisolibacter sp.]MDD3649996.1 metalloregulator ArsR/SmtB family transcription factor [Immundisolibacter sp.]